MSNPTQPIVPVSLSVTPTKIAIAFGTTVQLVPVLTGSGGNPFTPTKPFTYSSSNTALLTVNDSGLCTAVTPDDPNALNTGGIVTVSVTYPYSNRTDNETISVVSVIKVLSNSTVSAFVPQAPAFDLTYAENSRSGVAGGCGWKVIPQ
jgi:hypothetical protein